MPLTTRSGRQPKAPLRADNDGNQARSRPGPKSANANIPRPRPKPRALARRSFVRNKSNGASEDPEAQLPDNGTDNDTPLVSSTTVLFSTMRVTQGTVLSNGECNGPAATNERETTTALSDSEIGNPGATNEPDETGAQSDGEHSSTIATNNRVNSAVPSSNERDGNAAVNERVMNASPSNGDSVIQTNEREKTAVIRPRRSGAQKSYFPSHEGKSTESSGSDSDWAETEERRKKAESRAESPRLSAEGQQKGQAVAEAPDHDDDSEGCDEEDRLEEGDETTHKAGRLSKEAILAVHDFGKRVQAEATEIGERFGKHRQVILTEAGLARKATRKESIWNQHQAWFKTVLHLSKAASLQAWKAKQAEHYHAHSYKDPKNAALWKQIREHFDHAIATPDGLSSRESCSLMMAVREMFAKSALYWHHTYGIHVAGIVIYPGDEESGRQASGFFAGSDIVKALIDAQRVDAKHMIDEITTILKYKDLEAAQAAGKNIKFLPPPAPASNASLLRNGKSDRDRNRMVAPVVISEAFADAGHALKTSNSRWMTMLDVLYSTRLCIHDWPAGVPPPGPDFDLKSLSASQLRALVGPYLRIHLGDTYEAELGRDEDEDDSDAEKAKMAKRKGKIGVLMQDLTSYTGEVYTIPLVIDTDGVILRRLKDSEKFIKDLPPHVTRKQLGKTIREEYPTSDASAEHSFPEASHPNLGNSRSNSRALHSHQQVSRTHVTTPRANSRAPRSNLGAPRATRPPNSGASRSNQGASRSNQGASRSNQGASRSTAGALRSTAGALRSTAGALRSNQVVTRHMDYDDLTDYNNLPADYDDIPPSSPFLPATPRGSNTAHGRHQYNRLREDIRHSFGSKSDTRKRPRGDYETISEVDEIETGMVEDRRLARMHDRTSVDQRSTRGHQRKPIAGAPSMAHSGAVTNNNTARLASRSSVVPYADRSPSRQHGRRVPVEAEYEFDSY
ncbi:hypothetical protein DEU56DRAFT_753830 [Suillus clintonianus]|uniref:uncharacterized protein n=1 Tax=Suillus clintonianus TaxID=1904413 RepID=UPI001B8618A2|nr:uncharacterized protein DEU56DRAFT_753830 [Suillus clintonianus]KAG2146364.1 hypothetical protein DEU56DRAFT_753830 [Suillus clintonianus]